MNSPLIGMFLHFEETHLKKGAVDNLTYPIKMHFPYVDVSRRTCTVPAFNSCTKCVGSPDILHDQTPDCHPIS